MNTPPRRRLAALTLPLACLVLLIACKDKPAPVAPSATLTAVAVKGIPATFEVGATATLTASATYSDGTARDCTTAATWTSSNAAIAKVSSSGALTAVGAGDAQIAASCSGVTGSGGVHVTLGRTVVAVAVTGVPADPFLPLDTASLTATASYSTGEKANCTSTGTWVSSNADVATVAPGGVLAAVAAGATEIRVTCNGWFGMTIVRVAPLPPPPTSLLSTGYAAGELQALWNVTPVWFDASRSTGVGLTYFIEFGDGQTSTATTVWHTPLLDWNNDGWSEMGWGGRLTVTDRWGRTSTAPAQYHLLRLQNFLMDAYISVQDAVGVSASMRLSQDPANPTRLSGNYFHWSGSYSRDISGTVNADRNIHLQSSDGALELTGTVSIKGTFNTSLLLRVRGGPDDGKTVTFYPHDPY